MTNKILRRSALPFKYLLLLVSYLIPRDKKLWCFGASFNGNAKYLYIYMVENMANLYHCVWIGEKEDVDQVRHAGLAAYRQWSLKGLYYTLRGGVYVYNSYPANVNLYTMGGAKLVNLWHGVALKCIDRQIKDGPTAKYYQAKGLFNEIRYLNFRKHADVVLSTSPLMTENFSEAFDVTEKEIVEGIYPRCDLFTKSEEEIKTFITRYEGNLTQRLVRSIQQFDYTYIYLPTWRDTGDDFISECGFDFDAINEVMKRHNRLFLLKMHPDSRLKFDVDYSNVRIMDKEVDIYPILPLTDCLITDFSSIYFDYILMEDKQIILFIPDYEDYINKSRALKYPYDDVMKGMKALNFEQLLTLLVNKNKMSSVTSKELDEIRERFWLPKYKNMETLVDGIKMQLYGK